MDRALKDEGNPRCSEVTGHSYEVSEVAKGIGTFLSTYVSFVSFCSSYTVGEARDELVKFAGGMWTGNWPIHRARECVAFFSGVEKSIQRVNGSEVSMAVEDRACKALLEASHLVDLASRIAPEKKERDEAREWLKEYAGDIGLMLQLKAAKRGPWQP